MLHTTFASSAEERRDDFKQLRPAAPSVCIVTHRFGLASEVWVQRQIAGFTRVAPWVLTRERRDESGFQNPGLSIVERDYLPHTPTRTRRWKQRLRCFGSRNFLSPALEQSRSLREELSRRGTAAMLCHFGPAGLSLLPAATALNIPLVVHFHGFDLSSALRGRWYRWSLIAQLRRFAGMVVVGTQQRQWLLDHGAPADRVHLIPCGVPTREFLPKATRTRSDRIRFVAVARLEEGKGHAYAIHAFAEVVSRGIDADFVIIGDGSQRPQLLRIAAEKGVGDRIAFRGALPNHKVRDEIRSADILIQPSFEAADGTREGFGVSLAEASATALPVIATLCGGIMDQVVDGETGLLVEQRDVARLAEAMVRLAGDPDLRMRLGANGRRRMEAEYDSGAQTAKLEKVLLDAITRHCA